MIHIENIPRSILFKSIKTCVAMCLIAAALGACSNGPSQSADDNQDAPRFHASLINVGEELPLVVIHRTNKDDVEGFLFKRRFKGSFLPKAPVVIEADQVLVARLKEVKPGKHYLRQYGGFHAGETEYLWVQLTAQRSIATDGKLDSWNTSSFLTGFISVWDGGDDFGEAAINLESGEIVLLQFNGDL